MKYKIAIARQRTIYWAIIITALIAGTTMEGARWLIRGQPIHLSDKLIFIGIWTGLPLLFVGMQLAISMTFAIGVVAILATLMLLTIAYVILMGAFHG